MRQGLDDVALKKELSRRGLSPQIQAREVDACSPEQLSKACPSTVNSSRAFPRSGSCTGAKPSVGLYRDHKDQSFCHVLLYLGKVASHIRR